MSREAQQLIRRIKRMSPEEVARLQQFADQMHTGGLRAVPVALKAIDGGGSDRPGRNEFERTDDSQDDRREDLGKSARGTCEDPSAAWRRRPFQAINIDDLQPIAALFREAVDHRAANRQRFGSR